MPDVLPSPKLLRDARVYLSGPMDFVASRAAEQKFGWRNRVGQFLSSFGVTVFDPWFKPELHGLQEYGKEDDTTAGARADWSFESGKEGAAKRSKCSERFWPAMHIDLRMVDTSDFVVAYCPTNIYSVGTPHEIILARQQRKPVLFVSPYVTFDALKELREHLTATGDKKALDLLARLQNEVPIKENPSAAPSLWYMPLIGSEHFFDGFGFAAFREKFNWPEIALDAHERRHPPTRPLLPFIEKLNESLPKKWNRHVNDYVANDDWLLWKLSKSDRHGGQHIEQVQPQSK